MSTIKSKSVIKNLYDAERELGKKNHQRRRKEYRRKEVYECHNYAKGCHVLDAKITCLKGEKKEGKGSSDGMYVRAE